MRAVVIIGLRIAVAAYAIAGSLTAFAEAQPKTSAASEEQDDRICRGHVYNCSRGPSAHVPGYCSTYEQCRREMIEFRRNPPATAPDPGTTVIIIPR
jgi:hypothetical protein